MIAATTSAYQVAGDPADRGRSRSAAAAGGTPDGQVGQRRGDQRRPAARRPTGPRTTRRRPATSRSPAVEARPAAMLDTVAEAGQNLAEVDVSAVMPRGGRVATGKRRSKIGNGGPGYGFGPGDGGVRREDRWSILYKTGQTADEYARQLDAFGVELAIVSGNQLIYVSNFSQARPTTAGRLGRRRQAALLRLAGPGAEGVRPRPAGQGRARRRRGGDLPVLPRRGSRRPWSSSRSATRASSPPRSAAPGSAWSRPATATASRSSRRRPLR